MPGEDLHISDQELLQAADGELPRRRAGEVHGHLMGCWNCRARMAEIEATIVDFVRIHRESLASQLPPPNGSRAFLRAQLAQMASLHQTSSWRWLLRFIRAPHAAAIGTSAITTALVCGLILLRSVQHKADPGMPQSERAALPERSLTPGATRNVAVSDVCSIAHEEVVREVPDSMRQEVFQEYGIVNARASDYEIDYLIAPGLGGADDIHNLWPQPFTSRTWNAHVKDALEERLHQLVCSGNLDLHTAQSDISSDWIAAYKKYFRTERPLTWNSDPELAPPNSELRQLTHPPSKRPSSHPRRIWGARVLARVHTSVTSHQPCDRRV